MNFTIATSLWERENSIIRGSRKSLRVSNTKGPFTVSPSSCQIPFQEKWPLAVCLSLHCPSVGNGEYLSPCFNPHCCLLCRTLPHSGGALLPFPLQHSGSQPQEGQQYVRAWSCRAKDKQKYLIAALGKPCLPSSSAKALQYHVMLF